LDLVPVRFVKTTKNKLQSYPKTEGTFIYTSDTHESYWDISSTIRAKITDIIEIDTEQDRINMLVPISSFYYVKETSELWRYDGGWKLIQSKPADSYLEEVKDKHYVYNQAVASQTWNVNHNLNKYPSVTVVDSAGTMVIGEVNYVDKDNLIIKFSAGFSGTVYLN
jgi:hypothetical protein